MGGKKKTAPRTKGNTRPSSSGRSAAKLAESGASSFVGFSTWQGEPSYIPATQGSEELDAVIDADFRMVMRKMSKRDVITKLKAIQEFTALCKDKDLAAVRSILPFWPRVFNKLSMDHERRIREAIFQALEAVVTNVQKYIAPYLRSIMGCWMLGQCDCYPPAATAALRAFSVAFPPSKQVEAIVFCKNEIMHLIEDNLLHQNAQSLSEAEFLSEDEAIDKYERVISSTLLVWKLFLRSLDEEEHKKLEEIYKRILTNDLFWKYHKHKSNAVRGAWFSLVSTICHRLSGLMINVQKIFPIVFNNLDDSNPLVAPAVWEAASNIIAYIEDCWQFINVHKTLIPKLKNVLRKGGSGNASSIYPYLLPLLKKIPADIIIEEKYFYRDFFSDMRQGMFVERVISSQSEINSILKSYLNCLTYVLQQMITLNISEAEDLLIQQLIPMIQTSLQDPKAKSLSFPLNAMMYNFLSSLYYCDEKETCESLRILHDSFWRHLGSICLTLMETDKPINSTAIDQITELFLTLHDPARAKRNKKCSVHFSDAAYSEASTSSVSPVEVVQDEKKSDVMVKYLQDKSNPFFSQLKLILFSALDGSIRYKSIEHLKCLASLLVLCSTPEIYDYLMTHENLVQTEKIHEDSAFAFFESFTKLWITCPERSIPFDEDFSKILGNLTLASYLAAHDSETKYSILKTISKSENALLIKTLLHMVVPLAEKDKNLQKWLKGEELSYALVSIAKKLCILITDDENMSSCEVDIIWKLLSYVLSTERMISNSCLGSILDAFRLALPKPGSTDLNSTKQLETVLHFISDLATQIFENFKDCWQIPTVEGLVTTMFFLSITPPSNVSGTTLGKIQDCWTNGVKALLKSNRIAFFDNGFLPKSFQNINSLVLANKLQTTESVIESIFTLLKCIKEEVEVLDATSENSQRENVLEYLRWILPSESCWHDLRKQLGNQWMIKAVKEEVLTALNFSSLQEVLVKPKQNVAFLHIATFSCKVFIDALTSEHFSKLEKEILSLPSFFYHLKEMLFGIAYCEMVTDFYPRNDFLWKEHGQKMKDSFLCILSRMNDSLLQELAKQIFRLSREEGYMWSVCLKILCDMHAHSAVFDSVWEEEARCLTSYDRVEEIQTMQALKTLSFPNISVHSLLSKLQSCGDHWDVRTVSHLLAVASKIVSSSDVNCTETHETLLKILNVLISWRDVKNNMFLFSCDIASTDHSVLHFNYEVQRFLIHFVPKFSIHLNRTEWDFILCGVYSWLQSCFDGEITVWEHSPALIFMRSSCLLLRCLCNVITSSNTDEMNHSNLITEWNEFFSDGIFSILLPSAVSIAETCEKGDLLYIQKATVDALMLALENIPLACLENHKLSTSLNEEMDKDNQHIPNHLQIILQKLSPLLLSSVQSIQLCIHRILLKIIPSLKSYEDNLERIENKERNARQLPLALHNILTSTTEMVNSFVAEMSTTGHCSIVPNSSMFSSTLGYLLAWNVVMELFSSASSELRSEYASYLQDSGLMHDLLANLFFIISENTSAIECYSNSSESPSKSQNHTLFLNKPKLCIIGESSFLELLHQVCHVYFLSVKKLPVLVRQWWNGQDKRVSSLVDKITSKYVTPLLCADEFQSIQNSEKKFENMTVRARLLAKEVVATYVIDEVTMELIIKLSPNHPLGPVTVDCGRRVGVGNTQWRNWMLQLNTFLIHQNGSLLDGLTLWKQNVDKKFEGVEECYICYYILHGSNCQLPRLMCRTCKKKFHSACLYKWFNTSNQSTCPLCRNIF